MDVNINLTLSNSHYTVLVEAVEDRLWNLQDLLAASRGAPYEEDVRAELAELREAYRLLDGAVWESVSVKR